MVWMRELNFRWDMTVTNSFSFDYLHTKSCWLPIYLQCRCNCTDWGNVCSSAGECYCNIGIIATLFKPQWKCECKMILQRRKKRTHTTNRRTMQRKLKRNRIREREKESGLINGTWCCKIFHMYQCVHLIFKWYRRNKPAHNCGSPILVTTTAKLFALLSCCLELMCRLNIGYCVYLLLHCWTECTSFSPAACLSVCVSVSPSHVRLS